MNIREAEHSDVESLLSLADQLGYPADKDKMEKRLKKIKQKQDYIIFVAELKNHVIAGWIFVMPRVSLLTDNTVEIGGLIVDQKLRSSGIGRSLMHAAEAWSKQQGYSQIVVRSNVVRTESHNFYPKLGYTHKKSQEVYTKEL